MNQLKYILLFLSLPFWGLTQQSNVQSLMNTAYQEEASGASAGQVLASWLLVYDAIQKEEQQQLPEVCMTIAKIYQKEELHEQALPYYLQALAAMHDKDSFTKETQKLYQVLGQTYANISKPDSAFYFYNSIVDHHKKTGNNNGRINAMQDIVDLYALNGQHDKALEHNLLLKQVLEEQKRSDPELMRIYNNLGYNYNNLKNYEDAIYYFEEAKVRLDKDDLSAKAILAINIGIAYYNLGEFDESIKHLKEAKKIKSDFAPKTLDEINHLMATVYFRKKDFYNALEYSQDSRDLAQSNKNDALLVDVYYTTALIHSELYEDDQALDYFKKHLVLRDSFALEEKFRQQELLQQSLQLERAEKETKLLIINKDVQELAIAQLRIEAENRELEIKNKEAELVAGQKEKELLQKETELLQKENEIKESKLETQALETQRAKQELELARQRLLASQQEQEVATLQQNEILQNLEIKRKEAELANEQKDKELILNEKEISELALEKQNDRIQFFYGLGALMALILLIVGGAGLYLRRLNRQLNLKNEAIETQKEEITSERNKSDQLLLNILPAETAQELKENGFASPKHYDHATVMFTDFSGFTQVASSMTPEQLIEELNYCFLNFDAILEKHGLEKIKTIGDAYMCVAGVPKADTEHYLHAIRAGKEIVAFMNNRVEEKKAAGQKYWNMRMGIHSGPVVAGVVGKKKFAYDIWGDTVNIASRMESNGADGRINISEATYELAKGEFVCEPRGKIMAKNVGEVSMYFVK